MNRPILPRIDLARLQAALKWPREAGPARVVQTLSLGPGSRLLVVEFGGRHLLIGQARGGLVHLGDGPSA
jgi:Flagellar biosynthesis protein, FliO